MAKPFTYTLPTVNDMFDLFVNEDIWVSGTVIAETTKALLISWKGRQKWLPKSAIVIDQRDGLLELKSWFQWQRRGTEPLVAEVA